MCSMSSIVRDSGESFEFGDLIYDMTVQSAGIQTFHQ